MPHLWIRGIGPEQVKAVSRELVAELAAICECPPDNIMLECLMTTAVFDGEIVPSYPFVEVTWFDRGLEAQDRFALAVDRYLRVGCGLAELEVAFRTYEKRNYYANGESFSPSGTDRLPEPYEEELTKLRSANRKLTEDLSKARRALQSSSGGMSTKLREALRE
ncbi:DUF1904 family protein [Cohnella thailandensis]|uniref:DUF1904 family protein n=1 Tax=Cohnella thailandensis TaxID=557557 RepID=A0A841SS30_9BACL|nr:DUF1904 family protein [Cohnella thailandensis]MBB6635173.1 DUF1904 family protein [Cohnella thailandensis]MBP1974361.1 phenylpyruvate tautomerase PptA (4-oxalocrotonate tautomerase family) [Cohnella thailandensis]